MAVGEHGAVARSTDAGITWRSIPIDVTEDLAGVSGRVTGDLVASGKGGALLVSHDRGVSWSKMPSPASALGPVWTDGADQVLVAASSTLWHTVDAGKHWTAALADANCGTFVDVRSIDGWLYAGSDSCVARSSDNGATWVDVAHQSGTHYGAVWREGDSLAVFAGDGAVRSADGGKTWAGGWQSLKARAHDTWGDNLGRLVVGERGMIERTLDHGQTWVDLAGDRFNGKMLNGVVASRGALVVVGEDGLVRRSTDGGAGWLIPNAVTDADLSHVTLTRDGTAYAAGQYEYDGRIVVLRSKDGGATWEPLDTRHDKQLEVLWASPAGEVFLGAAGDLEKSADGKTWVAVRGAGQLRVMAGDGDNHLFGLGSYRFVRSSDHGATWTESRITEQSDDFHFLACAPDGALYAMAHGWDGVFASSLDHGKSWQVTRGPGLGQARGLVATAHGLLVVSDIGVFRSADGGKTFKGALGGDAWTAAFAASGVVWAVGHGRVARSDDDGVTWEIEELRADPHAVVSTATGEAIAVGPAGTILRYGR